MAGYRRVYDSRHLQADCQEPGDQLRNSTLGSRVRASFLPLRSVLDTWNLTFPPCPGVWCYAGATDEPLTLTEAVTYTVQLSTTSRPGVALVDRVVALPTAFTNATSLLGRNDDQLFQATCDVITNDMK